VLSSSTSTSSTGLPAVRAADSHSAVNSASSLDFSQPPSKMSPRSACATKMMDSWHKPA
jgi:hypothetical protein